MKPGPWMPPDRPGRIANRDGAGMEATAATQGMDIPADGSPPSGYSAGACPSPFWRSAHLTRAYPCSVVPETTIWQVLRG